MVFRSFSSAVLAAAWLLMTQCSSVLADGWTSPIVAKGNKFFYQDSGKEFRIKGMAYYPRPNGGEMAMVGNYDWAADDHEDVWGPHLEIMQQLGVNTIRLYSVDPSREHDKFMCACSKAGIYVLVGMTAPCENCSIYDEKPPACYSDHLLSRVQMVYNAFAVYDNTLGFSVGNENNLQNLHSKDGTGTAPCVKALLRDARAYAAGCSSTLRRVPIGLDIADIPPRESWLQYYDCVAEGDKDEFSRADWIGFNPYVECNPKGNTEYSQSTGLQTLMAEYSDVKYSRPIMFGEFGCNEGENTIDGFANQRGFYDAKWMNEEEEMTKEIVGGNVFEFTTEVANLVSSKKSAKMKGKDAGKYGIGYFQPENCDHDKIPCVFTPYPEFENLQKAFTSTKESTLTMEKFKPERTKALTCPSNISKKLQATHDVEVLACSVAQPVCQGSKSNAGTKVMYVPSNDTSRDANTPTTVDTLEDGTSETEGNESISAAGTNSRAASTTMASVSIVLTAALAMAGL